VLRPAPAFASMRPSRHPCGRPARPVSAAFQTSQDLFRTWRGRAPAAIAYSGRTSTASDFHRQL